MSDASMPVALLAWKPVAKGALRGLAKVRLGRVLVINDVPVLQSHGKCWASMPGKPMVDRDGQPMRNAQGKARYQLLLEWSDRDTSDRFSAAVVAAVQAEYASDLADEGVAA